MPGDLEFNDVASFDRISLFDICHQCQFLGCVLKLEVQSLLAYSPIMRRQPQPDWLSSSSGLSLRRHLQDEKSNRLDLVYNFLTRRNSNGNQDNGAEQHLLQFENRLHFHILLVYTYS